MRFRSSSELWTAVVPLFLWHNDDETGDEAWFSPLNGQANLARMGDLSFPPRKSPTVMSGGGTGQVSVCLSSAG